MRKRKEVGFDEMCRWIEENSPCVFRWPKVTFEQIEELEQYLLQRRREIEHEEMCS